MRVKSAYSYQLNEALSYKKFSNFLLKSKNEEKPKKNIGLKFKLHPELEMRKKKRINDIPRQFWISPDKLVELCAFVLDQKSLPKAFTWTMDQVQRWINEIGFPQYKETFRKNLINGRKLLLLADAPHLIAMNIKNFEHIQIITDSICKLFKIEKPIYDRNLLYYIHYSFNGCEIHFKFYRTMTGKKYEIKFSEFLRKMMIIKDRPTDLNHWERLENWLKHYPNTRTEICEKEPRYNLYGVKKPPKIDDDNELIVLCECMPPCECQWKESDYRPSWKLKVLIDYNESLKRSEESTDKNSDDVNSENNNTEKKDDNDDDSTKQDKAEHDHHATEVCHLVPPCTCDWQTIEAPSTISSIKDKFPLKYIEEKSLSIIEFVSSNYSELQ